MSWSIYSGRHYMVNTVTKSAYKSKNTAPTQNCRNSYRKKNQRPDI